MKTLAAIKKDLEFNSSLSTLIETLKTIAVSQYRALEKKIKTFKELPLTIGTFFEFLDTKGLNHPFFNTENKPQIVLAVTSDTGFLGGLNMEVIAKAVKELEKLTGRLIIIGECGKMYIRGTGIKSTNFPGISDEARYGQAMQVRDYVVNNILSGSFGPFKIIYPRPVSFTVQKVETVSFLPYSPPAKKETGHIMSSDVIMESRPEKLAEYLIYLWIGQSIYEIFGLSRLAEFAARYIHLEESAQKLKDLDKKVKLEYFRVRHELVDRTMRELFAGRLLYGNR